MTNLGMANLIDNDAIRTALTAPGAPFEMATLDINGTPCRIFRNCPQTLPDLYRQAERFAPRVLTVENGKHHTFEDVFKKAAQLARGLTGQFGVKKGQRVAIVMQNSTEWIIAFLAVTSLGAVAVLVNSRGAPSELDRAICDTDCSLVIADAKRAERLQEVGGQRLASVVLTDNPRIRRPGKDGSFNELISGWASAGRLSCAPVDGEDIALMMFTSGTTGFAKGVMLTQRSVLAGLSGTSFGAALSFAKFRTLAGPEAAAALAARQAVSLMVAPMFHVSGCHNGVLAALSSGGKLVILNRWIPEEALRLIDAEGVQSITAVPSMLWDLLRSPDFPKHDLSSLAVAGTGGASFPPNLLRDVHEVLPQVVFATGYGMTETNGSVCSASGEDFFAQPESVGKTLPIADVKVVDDDGRDLPIGAQGEIVVRGALVMSGYFGLPADSAATFRNGWMHTGDLGRFDDQGRLYVTDRKKLMIISGGENIYCAEVERALAEHPSVREVLAVGVPHDRLGEVPVAVVVPQPGHSLAADEISAHARKFLAAYKVPHAFYFRSETLPRTHTDKVDRVSVTREILAEHCAAASG
ncbi:MAG: class I adenylate-forming enzyme family protein [Steroidobacteraceae bacterium]|jgi:long-chain acyl-CoA synthetase|nr:class I adenylate-forming enzyme family protein [Steroidobacteraceae bacterium]